MRLASGDKTDPCLWRLMHGMIDRVCRGKSGGSIQFRLHPVFKMQSRGVGPADMQAIGAGGNRRADE